MTAVTSAAADPQEETEYVPLDVYRQVLRERDQACALLAGYEAEMQQGTRKVPDPEHPVPAPENPDREPGDPVPEPAEPDPEGPTDAIYTALGLVLLKQDTLASDVESILQFCRMLAEALSNLPRLPGMPTFPTLTVAPDPPQ